MPARDVPRRSIASGETDSENAALVRSARRRAAARPPALEFGAGGFARNNPESENRPSRNQRTCSASSRSALLHRDRRRFAQGASARLAAPDGDVARAHRGSVATATSGTNGRFMRSTPVGAMRNRLRFAMPARRAMAGATRPRTNCFA